MPNSEKPLSRLAEAAVADALKSAPIVVLLGPARCGKTTLLEKIAEHKNFEILQSPPKGLRWAEACKQTRRLTRNFRKNPSKRFCIDDGQFMIKFAQFFNAEIAKDPRPGRFIIAAQTGHRFRKEFENLDQEAVKIVELSPLLLPELGNRVPLESLWLRGGFPESLFAQSDSESLAWRRRYPEMFMERHCRFPSQKLDAPGMRALLEAFVPGHGDTIRNKAIRDQTGFGQLIVSDTLRLFEWAGLVRVMPSNTFGVQGHFRKLPKIYLRDTGLLHGLLGIETFEQLRNHEIFSLSWETFAIENIVACMPGWTPSYFMTLNRTGISLVLERGERRKLFAFPTESAPEPLPSFTNWAKQYTNEPATMIIPSSGDFPEAYPISQTMRVMTLSAFCKAALKGDEG